MESQSQWLTNEFNALTCIDTALNLVELIRVDNKTAKHIRDKFTQSWLCQYKFSGSFEPYVEFVPYST